jgi:hypothetical protein
MLNIGNFFLETGAFTTASAVAWVDITDNVYGIDVSNSYFLVDGQQVPVTFSGIVDGQRMFYDPGGFYSDGYLTYVAHAQNLNGDVEEESYSLLYGYDIDFDDYVDWGPGNKIDIWMSASNLARCSNTSTDAYYFVTRDLSLKDLGASINPVEYVDLGVSIFPQSKTFFYDGTYTIIISGVRDYHGNELSDFSFSFTVENPND